MSQNFSTGSIMPGPIQSRARLAGFGLVELMVAMVIGMLGVIVMMQVFSMFEGQKRTTTSGDDAITTGAIALHSLQRDIQRAGWGISAINLIGCRVTGLAAGSQAIPLNPVTINPVRVTGGDLIPDGDGNTDTLLVVSGNGNGTVEGAPFLAAAAANVTSYTVQAPVAFVDPVTTDALPMRVVGAARTRTAGACNLIADSLTAQPTVSNATLSVGGVNKAYAIGDRLFMLGDRPVVRAYAVRNGNLTVCNWDPPGGGSDCSAACTATDGTCSAAWVPIANNIVSLRAQYGRDTAADNMDGIVDAWDQTIPATTAPISTNTARNMEACAVARIGAVRVALVARSSQPERTLDWPTLSQHVTTPPTLETWSDLLWVGTTKAAHDISSTAAEAVAITLPSPDPSWPTWQDFRYKVFQTVIPLRNITTQGGFDDQC